MPAVTTTLRSLRARTSFSVVAFFALTGFVPTDDEVSLPRDPDRRVLRLGSGRGDPRGLSDPALRAALIEAIQRDARTDLWGLVHVGRDRWLAREDGAGFLVDADGVELRTARRHALPSIRARLRTVAWGRDGSWRPLPAVPPRVRGNEAVFEREAGVRELWRHGPLGMHQLFELRAAPPGRGALVVRMRLRGELRARGCGRSLQFVDDAARVRARYGELFVRDAAGRRLPALLVAHERGEVIELRVDDEGARYPILVDPVWSEETTLRAPEADATSQFGHAVALSPDGMRAVVGAYGDGHAGAYSGAAYVFSRVGESWSQEARLTGPDAQPYDWFGWSVAVDGHTVVGAPGRDGGGTNRGGAYVFERNMTDGTWLRTATLEPSDRMDEDRFGSAVGVLASTIVVGAPYHAAPRGAVYTFSRSTTMRWVPFGKIGGPMNSNQFGSSVALAGDPAGMLLLIGAPGCSFGSPAIGGGCAHVYQMTSSSWSLRAQLQASDANDGDRFGAAVALHGNTAVIGAPHKSMNRGAAYVFVRDPMGAWNQQARLMPIMHVPQPDDYYGNAVAVFGDRAIVGAHYYGESAGAAYSFVRGGTGAWSEEAFLVPRSLEPGAMLGKSVALVERTALVGASSHAPRGAAHVFLVGAFCGNRRIDSGERCDRNGECCTERCLLAPSTEVCRPVMGPCDIAEEYCTGTAPTCPPNRLHGSDWVCRSSMGPCDVAETCTGLSPECPVDHYAPPETECRSARGPCDAPESCSGTSPNCPDDVLQPSTHVCRPSTDPACDPEEVCSGSNPACPDDVTMCGSGADAGPMDGGATDGGARDAGGTGMDVELPPADAESHADASADGDAGVRPVKVSGCACRTASRQQATPYLPLLLFVALHGRARLRARRRRQEGGVADDGSVLQVLQRNGR
ncbi:MAG: hypothetical protein NZ898_00275 [Myxococcota bacterium]|nr:hypothetical protein [Myxococcota bacterium]